MVEGKGQETRTTGHGPALRSPRAHRPSAKRKGLATVATLTVRCKDVRSPCIAFPAQASQGFSGALGKAPQGGTGGAPHWMEASVMGPATPSAPLCFA